MAAAGMAIAADWAASELSANAAAAALRQIKGLNFIVTLPFDWIDQVLGSSHPQSAKHRMRIAYAYLMPNDVASAFMTVSSRSKPR